MSDPEKTPSGERRIRAIRNLGIMAHIDAGKTTLTERLLYTAGRTHRMGEVHDGEAVMDWMDLERERGITITSAVTSFEWAQHELHLIDTPGHVDFTIEVDRSLRVLDGAVAVFDAAHGVEPQSETVWRQADHWHVPRIAFANKMDRVGADFAATLASMRRRFPDHVISPVQRPLGAQAAFLGLEDLVRRETIVFGDPEDPRSFTRKEGISEEGEAARADLVARLADLDEAAADALLLDRDLPAFDLEAALRRATLKNRFVPLLCGSALRNRGIPQVLDAICAYLPSPLDVPPVHGRNPKTGAEEVRPADDGGPLAALAFKVSLLDEKRRHVFVRVYSGRISEGDAVFNSTLGKFEKVSRVLLMHAAQRRGVPSLGAGQIFAVTGPKEARTGDTLCDFGHPIVLERLGAYEPVLSQAIEAASMIERDALLDALARIADEDPSFRFGEAPDTGQLLVSGQGELHLEVVAERIRREFGLKVRTGEPQVLRRETITRSAEATAVFERTLEEFELFAGVSVQVAPLPRGGGIRFSIGEAAALLPFLRADAKEAIEMGVREAAESGVLEGYPVQDVEVVLLSAEYREGASRPQAFKVAAADAVREAAKKAGPVILEPVMRIEIVAPSEQLGAVIGGVDARKGIVVDVSDRGIAVKVISAEAPLRRMFGFTTELRSLTQGRAVFTMRFDRFDVVA